MKRDKTICLNMIVKDECQVIERALSGIKEFIDYWVIVDTGSTDGTQTVIREYLKDIPGELHERPWVNFAVNRNEALQLARGKAAYIYFADADEQVILDAGIDKRRLIRDYYCILLKGHGTQYYRILMINQHPGWHWKGALHEYITNDSPVIGEILPQIRVDVSMKDGRRSLDPNKCRNDAKTLESALTSDPENSRHVFYLAQLYRLIGEKEKALFRYRQRVDMEGLEEETFWSMYYIGIISKRLVKEATCLSKASLAPFNLIPLEESPFIEWPIISIAKVYFCWRILLRSGPSIFRFRLFLRPSNRAYMIMARLLNVLTQRLA